jgi:CDP-glycerol glycerophosphotransferase
MAIQKISDQVYRLINKALPKYRRVMVMGDAKLETNALEVANYIRSHYNIHVYYMVAKKFRSSAQTFLLPGITLVNYPGLYFRYIQLTSKYIFSTHASTLGGSSKKQKFINVWHGVGHKKIRKLRGEAGIPADVTVATSAFTKTMFAECFDVPLQSVFISGYPRNDLMLRAKEERETLKKKLQPDLSKYAHVLIWMPTFRRGRSGDVLRKGLEENNPFQVEGFDDVAFNALLAEKNALCIVKPHYYASENNRYNNLSNIMVIGNPWMVQQGITLYHLLACTDILITDFSSVMMDYILMDQPVICFSTDLEGFKSTQGLYFDDIENWLPTQLIQDQETFFRYLRQLLSSGEDPHKEKRNTLKDLYFTFSDADSTKRLVEHVFSIA